MKLETTPITLSGCASAYPSFIDHQSMLKSGFTTTAHLEE